MLMKNSIARPWLLITIGTTVVFGGSTSGQEQFVRLSGAPCTTLPVLHCPASDCPTDRVINQGPTVEMKSRRTYFLDYPCDLKPSETVTLVLSLHGGGSYGNWQRHYFPVMDYRDKYRLVIATPNSPTRAWSEADDGYLQNIVESLVAQIGKQNIRAFWLVGHSQGGLTANRLLRIDFFSQRVDGWLSLSGGRLGGNPGRGDFGAIAAGVGRRGAGAAARGVGPGPPGGDFSFIYETGEREMDAKGLPEASEWATKYRCGARRMLNEIVDRAAGYVYDPTRQNPPNPAWGLPPRPGKARIYAYSDCEGNRVVADVVRLDKGHTEGLEPNVTEALIKLMLSAPGGKIQRLP
jgi:hypothetical protein